MPEQAKKPLNPGHPCYCTKPGHVWHADPSAGTWCGQPVHRTLANGNVAKTCQQCFDANEQFRARREALADEEQALETVLENERRWAQGKEPIAPEAEDTPSSEPVLEAPEELTPEVPDTPASPAPNPDGYGPGTATDGRGERDSRESKHERRTDLRPEGGDILREPF